MKKILLAAMLAGAGTQVQAYTITGGGTAVAGEGQFSSVAGAVTTDFNSGSLPGNYTGGGVQIGSAENLYASPPSDTSYYYTVGPSTSDPGTVSFAQAISYFGFYWGSPDTYNTLQLWNGSTLVDSFTGNVMASGVGLPTNGDWSEGAYVNIWGTSAFDKVVFGSSGINAFETDNHAYIAAIPEPETYAMLLAGLGLLGYAARRRKQKERAAA